MRKMIRGRVVIYFALMLIKVPMIWVESAEENTGFIIRERME